jgi:hypothetical protein
MLDMIDVTNTIESVAADFLPEPTEPQNERGDEIASLWSAHLNAKSAARATKEELRVIRAKLGERLHELKQVLAKPGRGGQWSSFLKERSIPRATADRLVERHHRSLNPDTNCVTEDVSVPTNEEVQTVFTAVWPKLRRSLRSRHSLLLFIGLLTSQFERGEVRDANIPTLTPSTATICPVSSDEDSIIEPELVAAIVPRPDEQI